MARKKNAIEKEIEEVVAEVSEEVPTFTLRADQPRHLHALMAAMHELPEEEKPAVRKLIREFDLYEEMHR